MKALFDSAYLNACTKVQKAIRSEKGDTNFISILIIMGVVIVLAGVFMGFKDQIVGQVENMINGFTIH